MKNAKQLLSASVLIVSMTLSSFSHASVLIIDDFSNKQSILDKGITVGSTSKTLQNINGSGLTNVSRTFIAEAPDASIGREYIDAGDYSLRISNNSSSPGIASVQWDFDPFDFTSYAHDIRLEVLNINNDPNVSVSVEMIVNGVSSSGTKTFSKTGDILFAFNDFTNPAVFNEINSLRLNFAGTAAWNSKFRFTPIISTEGSLTTVPLPTSFVLMGSVLLGFIGISRKSTPRS